MSGPPPEDKIALFEMALAVPPLAWIAAATLILIAAFFGYRALAAPADLTMSEAAVLRDEAELLRQIGHGASPDIEYMIRRGMLSEQDYILTPLEAAIAARHAEVVQLLVDNGTKLTDANLPRLVCLARFNETPDIAAFLQVHLPPGAAAVDCTGIRLPW
jgi:hypothetical protein